MGLHPAFINPGTSLVPDHTATPAARPAKAKKKKKKAETPLLEKGKVPDGERSRLDLRGPREHGT
jgi:hypothetical protein